MACNHGENLCIAKLDRIESPNFHFVQFIQVGMFAEYFRISNTREMMFWTGQCERCNRIFWACDSWDWVPLIEDKDQLELILQSVGIKYRKFASATYSYDHRTYFRKGTFDRDMTERSNQCSR